MKKHRKKVIISGLLTLFALANVIVTVSNENQLRLFEVQDADAESTLWEAIINRKIEEIENDNVIVYKHNNVRNIPCPSVKIYNGTFLKGSDRAAELMANLHLENTNTYAGTINGSTQYNASKKTVSTSYYEFSIDITLPGNNWSANICGQCPIDDPEKIGSNCVDYYDCTSLINASISAYLSALGV